MVSLGGGMEPVGEKAVLKRKKFPFYVLFTSLQDYVFPLLENQVLSI